MWTHRLSGDSDLLLHHGMRLPRVGGTGKLGTTSLCAVPELLHGMPCFVIKLLIATMNA
jgi:hypothetical protein